MEVFASDRVVLDLPDRHPFPIAKYRRLREAVLGLPADAGIVLCDAEQATIAELTLAHDPAYVTAVRRGNLPPAAWRRIGFPWSVELWQRARTSVGATIAACRSALVNGIAVSLAGGTHHAARDHGAGYCVFNDTVVAARVLQVSPAVRRVLVIDCDVHQGDGTARLTADDPTITTLSIHGAANFPARKAVSDLDVALANGTGDDDYLAALEPALRSILDRADADLAIFLAGADPYGGDRWGRLGLSFEGLQRRDRLVLDACRNRALPVAVTMAGGYAPDVEDIVRIHLRTVLEAAATAALWPTSGRPPAVTG